MLVAVVLTSCSEGRTAAAPSVAATPSAAQVATTSAAPPTPVLATLIPESIASEPDKDCADCLTAFDIFYVGGLIEAGFEIEPPYRDQARYIKIGESVCVRLGEGYTLSDILSTASSPGDRRMLEVMVTVAQQTYCTLPDFTSGGASGSGASSEPANSTCALAQAAADFDHQLRMMIPSGQGLTSASSAALSALTDIVIDVVNRCGYQTMAHIADQYPGSLSGWLKATAVSALGEISALPSGLRCVDLETYGLGPKQAVDYYFLWGAPALMDADHNGIPCETIWSDVEQYMPLG